MDAMKKKKEFKILAKGRGMSFRRNLMDFQTYDGEIAYKVHGEPQECFLGMVSGVSWPLLLFMDGNAEIALDFEKQNEDGSFEKVDLRTIK